MDEKLLKKLVLLNRKLMIKGWDVNNGYGDDDYKIFYRDFDRRLTVSINTYNGHIKYYILEYSEDLTLQETSIFYKIAGIFRRNLEFKIGKRL